MSDEHFSIRKQLEEMQQDIIKMSQELTKLTIVNDMMHQERASSTLKLSKLESEFTQYKGGLNLLKGITGILGAGAVAFCTWIVSSDYEDTKALQEVNQRHAVLSEKVERLHHDVREHDMALEKFHER